MVAVEGCDLVDGAVKEVLEEGEKIKLIGPQKASCMLKHSQAGE